MVTRNPKTKLKQLSTNFKLVHNQYKIVKWVQKMLKEVDSSKRMQYGGSSIEVFNARTQSHDQNFSYRNLHIFGEKIELKLSSHNFMTLFHLQDISLFHYFQFDMLTC